jgi:hypothetical protein
MRRHWFVLGTSLCLAAHAAAAPGATACDQGWLGVQAMVARVSPVGTRLLRRPAGGQTAVPLAVNGVLCGGDTLEFASPQAPATVELYQAGGMVTRSAQQGPYTVPIGVRAMFSAAAAFLGAALEGAGELGAPPSRPQVTASRGEAGAPAESTPIRSIKPLRDLPRQRIAADSRPIVGWRGGAAPYTCRALSPDGEAVWGSEHLNAAWCNFALGGAPVGRLQVRDAQGRSAGWNVDLVAPGDVPRPSWLPNGANVVSDADTTAWALWLWQQGGAEWRLQALAMLNGVAGREWAASLLLDNVLAETPVVTAR